MKDNRYNLVSNKSGVYFEVPQLNAEDQGLFSVIFNDTDMENETYSLTVTGELSINLLLIFFFNFNTWKTGGKHTKENIVFSC